MSRTDEMSTQTNDTRLVSRCARGYDWNTFNDSEFLYFGNSNDVSITWDATNLLIAAAADDSLIEIGDSAATQKSFDVKIYGNAASGADYWLWDASLSSMNVVNTVLNATTGRMAKFDGTVLTPNFGDGYGAIECNLNIGTGAVAGFTALGSFWVNMIAATTFAAGGTISPLDVGIYGPAGMTLTNSKMIMGLKMSCVIDDGANPGELYLFNTNIYSNALTAMFDINTILDIAATSGAASSGGYKFPILKERSTGTTWYANIYTS